MTSTARRRVADPAPVTVVTGAARGIGHRVALDLAAAGHRVVAGDIDGERLRAAFAGRPVRCRPFDVTRFDQWQTVLDEVVAREGRLDGLCNVAGVLAPGWIHDVSPEQIDHQVDVNVKGVMYGCAAASRILVRQGGGRIVNVASLAGIAPTPGNAVYGGTKHAVRGFSLALASELRARGVRVSVVCPGVVDTRMLADQLHRPEAALTFAAGPPLTVEQASRLVLRALTGGPVEICRPSPAVARLVNLWPALGPRLYRTFAAKGERAAVRLRQRRPVDPAGEARCRDFR